MNYPDPTDLRASADRIARSAQAVSDSSEYPRLALSACNTQADALRNLAETIESTGGGIPEKRAGMTGEERRERRAAILRLRAARLQVKAAEANRRSHDIGSRIPFGQPILVGHHSERGHRRAIEKMHNATSTACSAWKDAERLESRADSVERSHAINASDSDAVEALQDKIRRLTHERDRMKAVNAAWRKDDRAALLRLGIDEPARLRLVDKIATAYSWEKQPFPSWQLTNLGATLRTAQKRLEQVQRAKAAPTTEHEAQDGTRLQDCPEENRVRIFFTGKPADSIRAELKRHGFRWAPSLGCWQAYRNYRAMEYARATMKGLNNAD